MAGLPGTGKTVLAEQFLFANASADQRALYLTTLSEPLPKLLRYLEGFDFFDPERFSTAIHYQDIGQLIREHGLGALPRLIAKLASERGARFLVIDSFKALHELVTDPASFRQALFDLARVLATIEVTTLLVGEYGPTEIAGLPEFAVADGLIELVNRPRGVRDERVLRVHKLRGVGYLSGEHSFRITKQGIHAFPRLVGDSAPRDAYFAGRIFTGVPGLDTIVDGGFWRGSATLVDGPSGVGKTMLGLRYLLAGARQGEPGVLIAFQEAPGHLRRILEGFGADIAQLERDRLLQVLYLSPLELDLVELFEQVKTLMEGNQVQRLVVDALGDMESAAIDYERFRATVWRLAQYLGHHNTTGLFLMETLQEGTDRLSSATSISYMCDNVLQMRYLDPPAATHDRVLRVIKTRGSDHDSHAQPYRISAAGPELLTPVAGGAQRLHAARTSGAQQSPQAP